VQEADAPALVRVVANVRGYPLSFMFWKCESGGIGRRARLRIWYRKVWGFESPLSHHLLEYKL
jgi:hypothetical protein